MGTVSAPLATWYNYCDEFQVFACDNDLCDQCARSYWGGSYRNGGKKVCQANKILQCPRQMAGVLLLSTQSLPSVQQSIFDVYL